MLAFKWRICYLYAYRFYMGGGQSRVVYKFGCEFLYTKAKFWTLYLVNPEASCSPGQRALRWQRDVHYCADKGKCLLWQASEPDGFSHSVSRPADPSGIVETHHLVQLILRQNALCQKLIYHLSLLLRLFQFHCQGLLFSDEFLSLLSEQSDFTCHIWRVSPGKCVEKKA